MAINSSDVVTSLCARTPSLTTEDIFNVLIITMAVLCGMIFWPTASSLFNIMYIIATAAF